MDTSKRNLPPWVPQRLPLGGLPGGRARQVTDINEELTGAMPSWITELVQGGVYIQGLLIYPKGLNKSQCGV